MIVIDTVTNVMLIVLLAALLLPILSNELSKHNPKLDRQMRYVVFGVYVLANLYETILFRTSTPDRRIAAQFLWSYREALQIFGDFSITDASLLIEIVLNILLYMPMGYLLPYTFKRLSDKKLTVIWIGFFCSVATELTQLIFRIGLFEWDDMLNNTVGCVIGLSIYVLWMRRKLKTEHQ